jgi:hypothetical protein
LRRGHRMVSNKKRSRRPQALDRLTAVFRTASFTSFSTISAT